jgi:hypothetical protein
MVFSTPLLYLDLDIDLNTMSFCHQNNDSRFSIWVQDRMNHNHWVKWGTSIEIDAGWAFIWYDDTDGDRCDGFAYIWNPDATETVNWVYYPTAGEPDTYHPHLTDQCK